MTNAMHRLAEQSHPAFPVTIYYAFSNLKVMALMVLLVLGWETFLGAILNAGFAISGTWPMRTEITAALKNLSNSLASSIVLVCRSHANNIHVATRRDFVKFIVRTTSSPRSLASWQHPQLIWHKPPLVPAWQFISLFQL